MVFDKNFKIKLLLVFFLLSLLILPRLIIPQEIPDEKIISQDTEFVLEYPVEDPKIDFKTEIC